MDGSAWDHNEGFRIGFPNYVKDGPKEEYGGSISYIINLGNFT